MQKPNITSIKKPILLPLISSYAVIILIFFIALYMIANDNKRKEAEATLNNVEQSFLRKIDETAQLLSSQIYVLEQSFCIQSALTQNNINQLHHCSKKIFSILQDMFFVTEINYFNNKKEYLLRINNYEKIANDKNLLAEGFVETRALNTNELSYGVQLLKNNQLSLVTSRKIESKSPHSIYIEIKLDMGLILDSIENSDQVSLLVLTERNEQQIPNQQVQKSNRHQFDFNTLAKHFILYGSDIIDDFDKNELEKISSQITDNQIVSFQLDNGYYSSGQFSLLDGGGNIIGHIIVLNNNTHDTDALNLLFSKMIIVIAILSFLWFYIFIRYLNKIDIRLNDSYTKLSTEIEERKAAQKKIKAQDELIMTQSRHAAMGEMISMIAHQWRQPLSVIAMEANNMLADIEFDEVEIKTFADDARNIIEQTRHLSKTIDDFRNFFRPGKKKELSVPLEIMEECLSIIGKSLENNNIEVIKKYQSTRSIMIYSRELLQVLINILKNAKEALLEHCHNNRKLIIEIFELKNNLHILITDNAGGITADIQKNIFDPYFSTKDKKTGTGLGLYMSKTIIEEHLQGTISVKNTSDGAQFIIQLPIITTPVLVANVEKNR
ncbi:MAG: HAMP domain-containing sensor histidine kinase [Pseudomonadota bacterium]